MYYLWDNSSWKRRFCVLWCQISWRLHFVEPHSWIKCNTMYVNKNLTSLYIYNWRSLTARPIKIELQNKVIFCPKKRTPPWVLRIGTLFSDFINPKILTQVCYYRCRKFVINLLQNRQNLFELILRAKAYSSLNF